MYICIYIYPLSQPNLKINLTQNIYPIRRYGISQQKIHHVLPTNFFSEHLFVHKDPRSCAMQANSYATELVSFDTWKFQATLRWSVGEFSSSWWFQPTSSSLKRETQKWNKTHMEHINLFEKYVCSQIGSWNPNLKGWKFQKSIWNQRPTGHAAFHPEKKRYRVFRKTPNPKLKEYYTDWCFFLAKFLKQQYLNIQYPWWISPMVSWPSPSKE